MFCHLFYGSQYIHTYIYIYIYIYIYLCLYTYIQVKQYCYYKQYMCFICTEKPAVITTANVQNLSSDDQIYSSTSDFCDNGNIYYTGHYYTVSRTRDSILYINLTNSNAFLHFLANITKHAKLVPVIKRITTLSNQMLSHLI